MKFSFLVLILLISLTARSQNANNTDRADTLNIYYQSLFNYFKFLPSEKSAVPDSIYLENVDVLPIDSILSRIGNVKVIKLDYQQLVKLLKVEKKRITLYRLFPLTFKSGEFSVSFVPFGVSYDKKKKQIHYGNGGSYKVIYKYLDGRFIFIRVEDIYL